MRSLFVTPMLPTQSASDAGGKHRRAGAFLRALGEISSRVDIVYLVPKPLLENKFDAESLNLSQSEFWKVPLNVSLVERRTRRKQTYWNHYGAGVFAADQQDELYEYGGQNVAESVGRHLDTDPDLVFADRLDAMIPILASARRPKRLFFDVDDLYHRVRVRSALAPPFSLGRRVLTLQVPALLRAERLAIAQSELAFVCSELDAAHLRKLKFPRQISVVPNSVDIPENPPGVIPCPTILYLGSFHHPPNKLAAERLVRRVWPPVFARFPNARLLIAGLHSDTLPVRDAGFPGVEFLGFVEDLFTLYSRSRVVCTPITTGSGTRLKLLEAGAHARPIVSTTIGAEGLDFRNDIDIMLRDDDNGLSKACIALLESDALCAQFGERARDLVAQRYDVRAIERSIVKQIRSIDLCDSAA